MKIGVITVARSDYSLLLPVVREILRYQSKLELVLIVAGTHFEERYGLSYKAIEADNLPIHQRVIFDLSDQTECGVGRSIGFAVSAFAEAYANACPDLLILLGDRFEMFAAGAAAVPLKIPIAHIHGGEETEGALDNQFRHALTKLSHLHFASAESYAARIIQMGEEPWRVHTSGAPGLDNLKSFNPVIDFKARFGVTLCAETIIVTLHPTPLGVCISSSEQIECLLDALDQICAPTLFTSPNADPGGDIIAKRIDEFCRSRKFAEVIPNLSTDGYFTALSTASVMVGNSSSGIIEAPSFRLPVVNIGPRQKGRLRAGNVIDVDFEVAEIVKAVKKASSNYFRSSLRDLVNPYGDGTAAKKIVKVLLDLPSRDKLLQKTFYDLT